MAPEGTSSTNRNHLWLSIGASVGRNWNLTCVGGEAVSEGGRGVRVIGADEILVIMRVEHLEVAAEADREALRATIDAIPQDYDELLAAHEAIHGEMFRRVCVK